MFPAKPRDVADAGVQVISHAYMLEWEGVSEELSGNIFENYEKFYSKIDHENMSVEKFLQTVKAKGLIFDPTLFLCMKTRWIGLPVLYSGQNKSGLRSVPARTI